MSEILSINGLDAHYGLFQALYGIDMTVSEGEVIAIIGANGAGKTTLMRSVSGLIRNGAAQITYRGQHIGAMAPHDIAGLGIALVPEGRQLFPSLSVEENLIIGGRIGRKGAWDLGKVYDLFPVLGERRAQQSTSLSGGQQQMVAIGRALMSAPQLLLLDEPSLGLAPIVVQEVFAALARIRTTGLTIVIVEQNARATLALADRAYLIEAGRITGSGPADTLRTDPAVVRAFLGGAPAAT